MDVVVSRGSELPSDLLDAVYTFRAKVFHEELKWDVPVVDRREIDRFDSLDPVWVVAVDGGSILGCWRILPTTGDYLMRDAAFEGISSKPLPSDEQIVEISRFAVSFGSGNRGLISQVTFELINATIDYMVCYDLLKCVFVTSAAIERLLRSIGAKIERTGGIKVIGGTKVVTCEMDVMRSFERIGLSVAA